MTNSTFTITFKETDRDDKEADRWEAVGKDRAEALQKAYDIIRESCEDYVPVIELYLVESFNDAMERLRAYKWEKWRTAIALYWDGNDDLSIIEAAKFNKRPLNERYLENDLKAAVNQLEQESNAYKFNFVFAENKAIQARERYSDYLASKMKGYKP